MSVEATTWAWRTRTRSSGQRLVLLALADHAASHDDEYEGLVCWPKVKTLAMMVGLDERGVRRHIDALVSDGLVDRVSRKVYGRRAGPTVYVLNVEPGAGALSKTGRGRPIKDRASAPYHRPGAGALSNNEPLIEPLLGTVMGLSPEVVPVDRFEEFWAGYGRVGPKKKAREGWDRALKKADPQTIIDGLARWTAYWAMPGAAKVKWPQGWLSEERWNDTPPSPQRSTGTKGDRSRSAIAGLLGDQR